jgi:hypothetical protein
MEASAARIRAAATRTATPKALPPICRRSAHDRPLPALQDPKPTRPGTRVLAACAGRSRPARLTGTPETSRADPKWYKRTLRLGASGERREPGFQGRRRVGCSPGESSSSVALQEAPG